MKDILGRGESIKAEDALNILNSLQFTPPLTETVELDCAYRRILSEDIVSPEDLPGFNRSTMDGYAVRSEDTFGASETMPVYLTLKGEVSMGSMPKAVLKKGEAMAIPTGGMLPAGTDAVVMYEYTNRIDDNIEVMKAAAPGENIIRYDEDVKKGETILWKGQRLRPQDIGALAGLGITHVEVFKRPVVSIISTGNEVVPPGTPLSPGEVRDINSYNLAGLVLKKGGIPLKKGIIKDDMDELRVVVRESIGESQMLLISGGSSVGTKDYTSRVIDEMGSPGVLFHGVTIKPGKPLVGAMVNGVPVFGLPGHPAAVTVCFENFVEPILRRISGETPKPFLPGRRLIRSRFSRNLSSSAGREEHVRVRIERRGDVLWAVPILGKSGLIRTLVDSDGVVVIPLNKTGLYEGEEVEVRLFDD